MLNSRIISVAASFGMALVGSPAMAERLPRQVPVTLSRGVSSSQIRGEIAGYEAVDYRVTAHAGQTMTVTFKPTSRFAFFNVLPPDSDVALFVGATEGSRYQSVLPHDGEYVLRVYLTRNAARRHEMARYAMAVSVVDPTPEHRN
ncbi:hypothetical protein ACDA63_17165 [Uliginosibacterium sp. sgz301328]|uniref:hypothetical protein n=1 Tax=Uliginosibacterium sp. sgz301328 TaxID=3243764 RepID=UPI00359DB9EA